MRGLRSLLLTLGVVLCLVLLWRTGLTAVLSTIGRLSWRLPLLLVFPAVLMVVCDTLGWRFAFHYDRVPFLRLLGARLAGEAVNLTTPTASVGGEAVKTWLVRGYVPISESLPSVVIAKTTITIAQTLFLLVGIVVGYGSLPAGSALLWGMEWLLILECLCTVGFVAVQVLGVTAGAGLLLERLGVLAEGRHTATVDRIDQAFSRFYRRRPGRLVSSIGWHLGGWLLGSLEAYCILRAMGVAAPFTLALMIDAFGAGVGFVAFMIPARLGAQEAGDLAVFVALGLGAPVGLTFSLVRRLREVMWAAVGFVVLAGIPRSGAVRPLPARV